MSRSLPDPSWRPPRVVIGAVGRGHGLDGFVHLVGHGGVVPLDPGTHVRLGDRDAVIVGRKGTADRPLVRFDIAATREQADDLRGADVTVAADALPATDRGRVLPRRPGRLHRALRRAPSGRRAPGA